MPTGELIALNTVFNMRWELIGWHKVVLWTTSGRRVVMTGEIIHAISWALEGFIDAMDIYEVSIRRVVGSTMYTLTICSETFSLDYDLIRQLFRDGVCIGLANHVCGHDYIERTPSGSLHLTTTCPISCSIRRLIFSGTVLSAGSRLYPNLTGLPACESYYYGPDRMIIVADTSVESVTNVMVLVVDTREVIRAAHMSKSSARLLITYLMNESSG